MIRRVQQLNSESWRKLPWKKFRQNLFRLQKRIWKAVRAGDMRKARSLFHARSYGFRTGRSAHDAQKILFLNLNSRQNGINKRVIEIDIKKCFDRISHTSIMDNLIAPSGLKLGIWGCHPKESECLRLRYISVA